MSPEPRPRARLTRGRPRAWRLALALFIAGPGSALAGVGQPLDGQPIVVLEPGVAARVAFDAGTARTTLPGQSERVRYHRFAPAAPAAGPVRLSVRVLAQTHRSEPRFTVLAPQLLLLDRAGQVRRTLKLDRMQLDIRPFRPTRLRSCLIVQDLPGFIIATDPARVGSPYRFDARVPGASRSADGFYHGEAGMQIFLVYADVGMIQVRVAPASGEERYCRTLSG